LRARQRRGAFVLVHLDLDKRLRQRGLCRGRGFGFIQRALPDRGLLLLLIGLDLLARDLARAKLDQDVLDRMVTRGCTRRADQNLLQVQ
jgi:hypothetical protein